MARRHALVVASQCEAKGQLTDLEPLGRDLYAVLVDADLGGCVSALPGEEGLVTNPNIVELDAAVGAAFAHADASEATLVLAMIGHGTSDGHDFYFHAADTPAEPDSTNSFLLSGRGKELIRRHRDLDGLVVLLDGCESGAAVRGAAFEWLPKLMEGGGRADILTSAGLGSAYALCFTRQVIAHCTTGIAGAGEFVHSRDLKSCVDSNCPHQTSQLVEFTGAVRQREDEASGDPGLWLVRNRQPPTEPDNELLAIHKEILSETMLADDATAAASADAELATGVLVDSRGERIRVAGRFVIGRVGGDLVVADPQVSRRHAVITATASGLVISDLQSSNGTFVNDERVSTPQVLADGDVVRVGSTEFRFAAEDPDYRQ